MPEAQVITVIAFFGIARLLAPVTKIAHGGRTVVFVVSGCRASARFEAAPRRSIAFVELLVGAVLVGEISRCKDRSRNRVDQLGGRFGAGKIGASGNVPGADQRERALRIFPD